METNLSVWQNEDSKKGLIQLAGEVFQIPAIEMDRPDVQAAIMKAISDCLTYGLLPARHVWLIPFNKNKIVGKDAKGKAIWESTVTYSVDIGVGAWEMFASKQAPNDWHAEYREMSVDDVKVALGDKYEEGCLGAECRIWIISKAQAMKAMGFEPEWHNGFYLVESKDIYRNGQKTGQKELKPEPVPAQRTALDTAKRRALKHALTRKFSPEYVGTMGREDDRERRLYQDLVAAKDTLALETDLPESHRAIMTTHDVEEDEDGILMAQSKTPAKAKADPLDFTLDDVEPLEFDDRPDYTPETLEFISNCKSANANSDGQCTLKQYQYVCGVIDGIIDGGKDVTPHGAILGAILDRDVSKETLIGNRLAKFLFDSLLEMKSEKNAEGKTVKFKNPSFDPQAVTGIQEIYTLLPVPTP